MGRAGGEGRGRVLGEIGGCGMYIDGQRFKSRDEGVHNHGCERVRVAIYKVIAWYSELRD